MNLQGRSFAFRFSFVLLLLGPGLAGSAFAQVARDPAQPPSDPLDAFVIVDPRLRPSPASAPFDGAAPGLASDVRAGWQGFLGAAGGSWKAWVDRRTGRVDFAEGSGLPWIPGGGNSLASGPDEEGNRTPDLARLEALARRFLPRVAAALGVDPSTLVLSQGRSGQPDAHLWNVDFDVVLDGLAVEGARVVFRVNNGNLVQFGTENLPAPGTPVPPDVVGREQALAVVADHVGGMSAADQFVDAGTVRLLPVSEDDGTRGLVRVWEISFRRRGSIGGSIGTWRARVDATRGELLDFRDVNAYGRATGGVHPKSYIFNDETVRPMPFADIGLNVYTDSAGNFPTGGAAVSTLRGRYVVINDQCGAISLSSNVFGNLAFGTSTGTDCTTSGSGGTGNTHAARDQFYHVNRAKEVGRGWLPGNPWLSATLPVSVNNPSLCNAFWDGGSLNFFRSGGCGNTGEIAAVSLHEYGHGLDQNDGAGFSPDEGTGEAYGDITAAFLLHDSCIGPGFYRSFNCGGYGDSCTSCTGVRDLDWAKHASNTPHTVNNFTRDSCGLGGGYDGPCGGEGHCESYVISEAVWDLVNRDLPSPGSAAAWTTAERLWYVSRPTATSAFVCHNTTPTWTSDGCATGSLFRTLRAADDDDGNLANGTPNSCRIFAALNRHGLACAGDAKANVCFSACTPPAVPTLSATSGSHQVQVSWAGSAPGAQFDVFRSETGCDAGFQRIAAGVTGSSFVDAAVTTGLTYSYRVVAMGAGNAACSAPPTACKSVALPDPPCTPPPAPTGLTATTAGVDRVALSWSAVAGALEYRVLRAGSAGGPFTQVAAVPAPALTYLDGLSQTNTTAYYVVRAATGETCVSASSNTASATTMPCQEQTLYQTGFETETGLAGWSVQDFVPGTTSWRGVQTCDAHAGSKVFRFGGESCSGNYRNSEHSAARLPALTIPPGSGHSRLGFWHQRHFGNGYDGGTLKISLDIGPWVQVPATALSGQVYDGGLQGYGSCAQELGGTPVFSFDTFAYEQTVVDLDAACVAAGSPEGCGGHTVRFGFETITDCFTVSTGWFLDDLSATSCVPHACTGAPVIGTASTPAAHQVRVNWTNSAPSSSSFNVYRALGTCAAPGPFERVASGVSGSSYLDDPVSGGVTWAYRVTGLDATGTCESEPSGCVQASPSGSCTQGPTFAGAAKVETGTVSTCTLAVSWAPATAHCGGPVTYDVFRSTSPDFTPSAANRVATGLTRTSFQDLGTLSFGTTYFYVARAVDVATGQSETNTVRRSGTPTGLLVQPVTLTDTFEAADDGFDLEGWSHSALLGSRDWEWSREASNSPTHSWRAAGEGLIADRVLVSPPVLVGPDTVLSFWHTFFFGDCSDGGVLEVSADGGPWTHVPGTAFLSGGYNGTIVVNGGNPLGGLAGWCGGTFGTMTQVRVDLGAWEGREVRVRWHMGEDDFLPYFGWFVDTVSFQDAEIDNACRTAPPAPLDFYTAPPCRLVDTRAAIGPNGGPALLPGETRTFLLTGSCGIPAAAGGLSVNITVVGATSGGSLILFPADQAPPNASSISFQAGQNRANSGLVNLSAGGEIQVKSDAATPVHLVLDVNGWFQ